jgi:hypothetical protein
MLQNDSSREVSPLALIAKRLHQRNSSLGSEFTLKRQETAVSASNALVQSTTANTKGDE